MERGELRGRVVLSGLVLIMVWAPAAWAHPELAAVQGAVDEALVANPDDAKLLMRQGRLREEARDWDGALVSFAHALGHGADADVVAAARAHVFLAAGFPRMAKLEYDALLAKRPDAYDLLFERGRAQLAIGQLEAADADWTRAIAHLAQPRPEHVIAHTQAWRAAGKPAEALRALEAGMARTGPLPALQLTAIDLDLEQQRFDSALARLDTLLKQTPTNEAWIAKRADILQRAGRTDEARAERARALQQIEARPQQRRSQATKDLAERLRSQLGSASEQKQGEL